MEVIVDLPRHRLGNAGDSHQVVKAGAGYRFCRAKMLQQGALPSRTDSRNLIQRVAHHFLLAPRPVRADGEAMRLVTHTLDEIKHGVTRWQREIGAPIRKEPLSARLSVHALCDADCSHAVTNAEFVENGAHRGHLALTTVDEDHVRPGREGHVGCFLWRRYAFAIRLAFFFQQAREATGHHLAHHAEVVARRDVGRFDVELAVLVLHETFRPRHHHAAHGIGAHNVGVIVNLDAARHIGKVERLRHAFQQPRLRRGFRQLAAMRLAGIGQNMVGNVLFLAALGHIDRHLVPGLFAEGSRQEFLFFDRLRQQDLLRHRFVIVELRQKRVEDFRAGQGGIGLRKIGAVAPVLAGAEKEHLNAGDTAFVMNGEDIRFFDTSGIDALMALDMRKGSQAVAIDGGALEIEVFGGLIHLPRNRGLDALTLAGQEILGFLHEFCVALVADLMRAGPGTALDLVEKTGARAGLEHAIRTGSDQEGALQRIDRAADSTGRCEGAEIVALARARAAMLEDGRRAIIRGDEDIGKGFVVTQKHVKARPQALDQIRFQEKRFGFRAGGDEFHVRGETHHLGDAVGVHAALRIIADALLQRTGLADVKNVARIVEHAIDARRIRQMFDELGDEVHALQAGLVLPARIPVHAHDVARSIRRVSREKACIVIVVVGVIEENTAIRQLLSVHSFISATSGVSQPRCWPPSSAIICPVTDGVS
ncbi:hypothetical protein AT6N2_C1210 [Agrobacterium tumefaciens]|nr:hypothetical protein AT6N2_C1210 [Agrobacterium tumefaciens]